MTEESAPFVTAASPAPEAVDVVDDEPDAEDADDAAEWSEGDAVAADVAAAEEEVAGELAVG
ncbi:MAG: hypothetical protein WAY93_07205, partial [Atopobiaceae bacterium]